MSTDNPFESSPDDPFGTSPFGLYNPAPLGGVDVPGVGAWNAARSAMQGPDAMFGADGVIGEREAADRNRLEYGLNLGGQIWQGVMQGLGTLIPLVQGTPAGDELAALQAQAANQQAAIFAQQQAAIAAEEARKTRNTILGVAVGGGMLALLVSALRSGGRARRGERARR